jgi:hypothetical protein
VSEAAWCSPRLKCEVWSVLERHERLYSCEHAPGGCCCRSVAVVGDGGDALGSCPDLCLPFSLRTVVTADQDKGKGKGRGTDNDNGACLGTGESLDLMKLSRQHSTLGDGVAMATAMRVRCR